MNGIPTTLRYEREIHHPEVQQEGYTTLRYSRKGYHTLRYVRELYTTLRYVRERYTTLRYTFGRVIHTLRYTFGRVIPHPEVCTGRRLPHPEVCTGRRLHTLRYTPRDIPTLTHPGRLDGRDTPYTHPGIP